MTLSFFVHFENRIGNEFLPGRAAFYDAYKTLLSSLATTDKEESLERFLYNRDTAKYYKSQHRRW